MHIHLHETLLLEAIKSEAALKIIEAALISLRDGNHYITAPRFINKVDNQATDLNNALQERLSATQFSDLIEAQKHLTFNKQPFPENYVSIIWEDEKPKANMCDAPGIDLPDDFFYPSIITCENESDQDLYIEIASHLHKKTLKFSPRVGHGSSTAKTWEKVTATRRPALCIVDSDKSQEGAPLGDTARNALNVPTFQSQRVRVLTVRAIENLFPPSTIKKICLEYGSEAILGECPRRGNISKWSPCENTDWRFAKMKKSIPPKNIPLLVLQIIRNSPTAVQEILSEEIVTIANDIASYFLATKRRRT